MGQGERRQKSGDLDCVLVCVSILFYSRCCSLRARYAKKEAKEEEKQKKKTPLARDFALVSASRVFFFFFLKSWRHLGSAIWAAALRRNNPPATLLSGATGDVTRTRTRRRPRRSPAAIARPAGARTSNGSHGIDSLLGPHCVAFSKPNRTSFTGNSYLFISASMVSLFDINLDGWISVDFISSVESFQLRDCTRLGYSNAIRRRIPLVGNRLVTGLATERAPSLTWPVNARPRRLLQTWSFFVVVVVVVVVVVFARCRRCCCSVSMANESDAAPPWLPATASPCSGLDDRLMAAVERPADRSGRGPWRSAEGTFTLAYPRTANGPTHYRRLTSTPMRTIRATPMMTTVRDRSLVVLLLFGLLSCSFIGPKPAVFDFPSSDSTWPRFNV